MIRHIAFAFILTVALAVGADAQTRKPAAAQDKSTSTVEIKDDRFTGIRRVRLPPMRVSPKIEMELTGEVNTTRKPDYMDMYMDAMVTVEFTTPYTGGAEFSGEMDFAFLIDGKRTVLRTPPASTVLNPYADRATGSATP